MTAITKYKHIVWDWNGTLLDDVHVCVGVLNGLLGRRNLDGLTVERYRAIFDFPVYDFYVQMGFDFDKEDFDIVADEYISAYQAGLDQCRLQLGALQVIRQLQGAGLDHSVLSAYQQDLLNDVIVRFGLQDCFIKLIGLDDYRAHSKVDNGRRWIQALDYDPAEVVFIGDTFHDLEVAQAMGVDCILFTNGHYGRDRLIRLGVPLIEQLTDLPDLLAGRIGSSV